MIISILAIKTLKLREIKQIFNSDNKEVPKLD